MHTLIRSLAVMGALTLACDAARAEPTPPPAAVQQTNALALCTSQSQAPNPTIAACTAVIQTAGAPADQVAEAFNARGVAFAREGDHEHAMDDYQQAIRLKPDFAVAYNSRGTAFDDKGDHDSAIADYTKALTLDGTLVAAYFNRASAYRAKGDATHALADLDTMIRLKPDSAEAYSNRCLIRVRANLALDQALSDCEQALKIHPNLGPTIMLRTLVLARLGRFDDVITAAGEILARDPRSAPALYVRGVARSKKGDTAGGSADMAAAAAISPKIAAGIAAYGIQP